MKLSKQQVADNRARIVYEAARLVRERGIAGAGVEALAEAAGVTQGALYSQFGAKDAVVEEALLNAFATFGATLAEATSRADYAARYLTTAHRDDRGTGCAVAAVGAEIPRQSAGVRRAFTDGVRRTITRVAGLGRGRKREDEALVLISMLVGAMVLARAVDDAALSEQVLAAARASVAARMRR